jgi:protein TonB
MHGSWLPRSLLRGPRDIEPYRIVALVAVIACHVALLLLILIPMHAQPATPQAVLIQAVRWVVPTPKPKPSAKPVVIPIARVVREVHVAARPRSAKPTPLPAHTIVAAAAVAAPPQLAGAGAPTQDEGNGDAMRGEPVQTGPMFGAPLQYVRATPPPYPGDAMRQGIQGTVVLRVLIDTDGRPLQVDVQSSSGDWRLDDSARNEVFQHWLFRPAIRDGRPVQAVGLIPIGFHLNG